MQYCSEHNHGCRILEYTHRNLTHIRLENELVSIVLVPDKGSDITSIRYKPKDIDFMWKHANIIDPSKYVSTSCNPLGNNLDYYEGGWHECFPGGGPYTDSGYSQGIHGEAALLPWDYKVIEDSPAEAAIELRCRMVRTPFEIIKTIRITHNSGRIDFHEALTNLSGEELGFMWGHHPVFGRPFLDEGCVIDIPAMHFVNSMDFGSPSSVLEPGEAGDWPVNKSRSGHTVDYSIIGPNGSKDAEMLFLTGLSGGRIGVSNPRLGLSFKLSFDGGLFGCVWYWKVLNGMCGYPWYGRTYNIGLEFWTGHPGFDAAKENGSIRTIGGYETIETGFNVDIESAH